MKSSSQLLVLGMLWPLSAAAAADGATATSVPPPDTSQWKCESCPFDKGVSGAVDAGIGYVSEKSAKFGEYNGLERKGAFFAGDGEARYRAADGTYWNVDAANLGLRSRSIAAEGGRQGEYKVLLKYDELQHFISDTAQTPFLGTGSSTLTLPAGFPAASTAVMPLAGTLQEGDLETQRKMLGVGGSWLPARDWEYAVNFRHETKDGTKRTAGAFFVNSAQLVEPVDYTTDQIDASVSYTGARWQAKVAYYGSLFRNSNNALTWQNPFTGFPGAGSGQLALPPDNEFHQLLAAVGYQLGERTRATADIAYGRMTQDESFLPPTLNSTLSLPALPASSLNGRVNTFNANVKLTSDVTDSLRLNALYARDERHNETSQATYSWVSTDMFPATPRTNLPYSFTQDKVKVSADFRAPMRTKLALGYDYDSSTRTFQEIDGSREDTVWAKVSSRALDKLDLSLKLVHAERDVGTYQAVAGITPPENPLLRKYNMADRRRESATLRADIAPVENVNIGLGAMTSRDDYSNSPVGLTVGTDLSFDGDISFVLTERASVHLFANHEEIKSRQLGSQSFSAADWSGENRDTIDFVGLGVRYAAIKDKLDLGADYGTMRTRSEITVDTGVLSPFPDMTTSVDSFRLYAAFRVQENMWLNANFWHERYDSKNWMLDNVTPATIPNVLTFGEQPPHYSVNVFRVSVKYQF